MKSLSIALVIIVISITAWSLVFYQFTKDDEPSSSLWFVFCRPYSGMEYQSTSTKRPKWNGMLLVIYPPEKPEVILYNMTNCKINQIPTPEKNPHEVQGGISFES